MSDRTANNKNVTDNHAGGHWQAGLSMNVKLSHSLDLYGRPLYYYGVPVGSSPSYNESSLRLFDYASHTNFEIHFGPAWSLHFRLIYNVHAWNLR